LVFKQPKLPQRYYPCAYVGTTYWDDEIGSQVYSQNFRIAENVAREYIKTNNGAFLAMMLFMSTLLKDNQIRFQLGIYNFVSYGIFWQ